MLTSRRRVESGRAAGSGSGAEAAVELIGPGVVRAYEDPPAAASLHVLVRSVPARVVEGADDAIAALEAEDAPPVEVQREVVSGPLELGNVSRVLAEARYDPGNLRPRA